MKKQVIGGYCKLCRAYEVEKYGTVLEPGPKHTAAVKAAKCGHQSQYTFVKSQEQVRYEEEIHKQLTAEMAKAVVADIKRIEARERSK